MGGKYPSNVKKEFYLIGLDHTPKLGPDALKGGLDVVIPANKSSNHGHEYVLGDDGEHKWYTMHRTFCASKDTFVFSLSISDPLYSQTERQTIFVSDGNDKEK